MQRVLGLALAVVVLLMGNQASAQSSVFDFEDGTDQGWGTGFGNDASANWPIDTVAGSKRIRLLRGGFQTAGRETGNAAEPFYQAMLAASGNEAGYTISYDWYVDTSVGGAAAWGNFLQLGTFVNTGSGYYAQNFPTPKEVELGGGDLASGNIFSGTVSQTFAAKGFDIPAGETFFRLGLIINGDGTGQNVHFDNIRVAPIPEPASMAMLGIAVGALGLARRRWN